MDDDTALAFRTEKGAVVVTGCSHSGICNICIHAREVVGQELHAVIGCVYASIGLYSDAERHLPAALELRNRVLGKTGNESRS